MGRDVFVPLTPTLYSRAEIRHFVEHAMGLGVTECTLGYAVQLATHAAMLSSLYISIRLRQTAMATVGGSTLLVSLLYHVAEVMNTPACFPSSRRLIWGLDDGRWHRLDNVFAIISLQLLCVHLANLRGSLRLVLQWSAVFITLVFQERNPWDLNNTIYPLVPYALLFFAVLLLRPPPLYRRAFGVGVLCMLPAALCFLRGLDDRRDYLRLWHGLWHVCVNVAVSAFMIARGRDDDPRLALRTTHEETDNEKDDEDGTAAWDKVE